MQSFRTELENDIIEKDIVELEKKIRLFHEGKIDPEKFRSLRLARGVYGQRQPGVQMVRIKVPYGKLNAAQLRRIADLSDEFSTGNIHLTTRQDVQLHFVSLDRTPELWALLEENELTMREACGNTVRNVTASATAGIDPGEPFDVTPYADALFRYFLRHPVGQDMGRKIKIAFSSSETDSAFTFIHDIGFIPRVEILDGKIVRGFKVVFAGGLGAQPFIAQTAHEFLPADSIIPFTEALLRVFDRYGERNNRHKARLKYLVAKTGAAELLRLTAAEWQSLGQQKIAIDGDAVFSPAEKRQEHFTAFRVSDRPDFNEWKKANVFAQKQQGWFGVYVKVPQGNISAENARHIARIAERYAYDMRITIGQSLLLRFVPGEALSALFSELKSIGFAEAGAESLADIVSCPGTDTCNLGISNSTGVSAALEQVIREEFPQLVAEKNLRIRISGCMNSCGQHGLAHIGFHGSSVKTGDAVAPALQLLLGGGATGNGEGRIAEKIIKFPSRRAPAVLRTLLSDFLAQAGKSESFHAYYDRQGRNYFYTLIRPFAELSQISDAELIDWNQQERFETAIGVGECAGVKIDLVSTLLFEAEEALLAAGENLQEGRWGDSIYKSYNTFVHTAKALLLDKNVLVNTQHGIITGFGAHYDTGAFTGDADFSKTVLQISERKPESGFAREYFGKAKFFLEQAGAYRKTAQTGQKIILN